MNSLVLIALGLIAADWDNLKEITKDRVYDVALRDGRCLSGRIVSSDGQQLVLDSVTIKHAEIARISDIPYPSAQFPVYSGRSSWVDVKAVRPQRTEYLQIVTNQGELLKWKNPNVSDDSIEFEATILPKADVKTISLLRFKPMTKTEQWYDTESATILAPRLWFHGLMLGKISVTLYNSAMIEDNSKLGCR
jgi:hypothetical protein